MRELSEQQAETRPAKRGPTRTSEIVAELRRDIIAGTLPPGARIKTQSIADRFEVGLSPVREALNRLCALRLLTQTDRRGFSVMPVSEAELADITSSRCLLNETALRASIVKGGKDWEERVLLAFHRLSRVPRDEREGGSESPDWQEAHRHFHWALISACDSNWILGFCDQLFEAAERYRHLGRLLAATRGNTEEEHRAIMQAAIDRRANEAVALLNAHFEKTRNHLKQVLAAYRG